jgi:predicted SnoaL-like aldol condensation-catalyzing enzyme
MLRILMLIGIIAALPAQAQVPVVPNADHEAMLRHSDPAIANNKRLVYDFWREVFEAAHMELAPRYMSEDYIQHNPTVPTGRQAFIDFFSRIRKPSPIEPRVKAPLVAVTGDGDLVILAFAREHPDPQDPEKKYTTTWFDMFRIADGRIVEHWDPALRPPRRP